MAENNPYAFPQSDDNNSMHEDYNGMMLRDYFAAKAMQGHLASLNAGMPDLDKSYLERQAKGYYAMADAMLIERNKQ